VPTSDTVGHKHNASLSEQVAVKRQRLYDLLDRLAGTTKTPCPDAPNPTPLGPATAGGTCGSVVGKVYDEGSLLYSYKLAALNDALCQVAFPHHRFPRTFIPLVSGRDDQDRF